VGAVELPRSMPGKSNSRSAAEVKWKDTIGTVLCCGGWYTGHACPVGAACLQRSGSTGSLQLQCVEASEPMEFISS